MGKIASNALLGKVSLRTHGNNVARAGWVMRGLYTGVDVVCLV